MKYYRNATHNDTHRDNIYIRMHKTLSYYVCISQIKTEIKCNRVSLTNDIEFHALVTHLSDEPDECARFVKDGTASSSAGIRKFSQICRRSGNRGTGVHTLHRHEATRHRQKLVSGLRGRWVNLIRGCLPNLHLLCVCILSTYFYYWNHMSKISIFRFWQTENVTWLYWTMEAKMFHLVAQKKRRKHKHYYWDFIIYWHIINEILSIHFISFQLIHSLNKVLKRHLKEHS